MRKWFIPLSSLVLALMSLLIIKSVAPDLLSKQLLFFIAGFCVFLGIVFIPEAWVELVAKITYPIITLLLAFLLILGQNTRGITAWIPLFAGFKLQPSQFALPFFVLFFITWWPSLDKIKWYHWLVLLTIWLVPGLLIFLQPDFGSSLIYFASSGIILFFLPIPKKIIMTLLATLPVIAIIGFIFFLRTDQQERITSFFSGYQEDQQSSYHAQQSLIAVGSGQFLGRGLGFGVQSHLRFLPERQTDFIFASFAEETGFLGSSFVVLVYLVLVCFLFTHALLTKETVARVWLQVTGTMVLIQAGINIGMNLGIFPITGITLPLFSYGGSSILSIFIMFAFAQRFLQVENHEIRLFV